LQLLYSAADALLPLVGPTSLNFVALGFEARYSPGGSSEVGIALPILTHADATLAGAGPTGKGTEVGNLVLKLKSRIAKTTSGSFSSAFFVNAMLPTGTNVGDRNFVALQSGVAFTSFFGEMFTLGVTAGALWLIDGTGGDVV